MRHRSDMLRQAAWCACVRSSVLQIVAIQLSNTSVDSSVLLLDRRVEYMSCYASVPGRAIVSEAEVKVDKSVVRMSM